MLSLLVRSVLALSLLLPLAAPAQVSVSINIAPPPLLIYAQPPVPGEGYIWMPGYWSWSDADRGYFWVPGTWVLAPNEGDLWTPGYWAFEQAGYFWHIGYWGPRVGFYGGINYGHGYSGSGYQGGRWDHGAFRYNRAISNVDVRVVHDAYNTPAASKASASRVSFNGGKSGTVAQPSASERQFQSAEHAGPKAEQQDHENAARGMPTQRATAPHRPAQVAATPKPSDFSSPNVEHVRAGRDAPVHGPATPARAPATEPPRAQPRAPTQARPEAPRAPRVEAARPEPRGQEGHADRPQPEGPARKER